MKAVFLTLAIVLQAGWALPQAALDGLEQRKIGGSHYVRLGEWARANRFTLKWTKPDEEITITSRNAKLVLGVTSRLARINDVAVYLNDAIVKHDEGVYVSASDLRTTFHPILFPPKNLSGLRVRTICLDPGHGGKDPGNIEGRQQEKKYTLLLAKDLAAQLKKAGFKVIFTRSTDRFVDLSVRTAAANKAKADLFLSLHYNGAANTSANGVETFCATPAGESSTNTGGKKTGGKAVVSNWANDKNMLLAFQIQKALTRNLSFEDRGVRRARFQVLREVWMPAALIECGFLSNPADAKRIYDARHRTQVAKAVVEGLKAYKQQVERDLPKE